MRVGSAATPAAAPTSGRCHGAVVRGFASGRGAGGQRHQTLEVAARALGTGHLLLAPYQLLELGAATGAAIIVDWHGLRFRRCCVRGQEDNRVWRSFFHSRRAAASSWELRDEPDAFTAREPSLWFPLKTRDSGLGVQLFAPRFALAPKVLTTALFQVRGQPGHRCVEYGVELGSAGAPRVSCTKSMGATFYRE